MERFRGFTFRALVLAVSFQAAGCSFVGIRSPRVPASPSEPVRCTSFRAAPVLDLVTAIGLTLGTTYYELLLSSLYNAAEINGGSPREGPSPWVLAGFAAAATYVTSAAYGFLQTSACEVAKAAARRCDPATGMNCGPLGLPAGTRAP